jgi:hypothetical protein
MEPKLITARFPVKACPTCGKPIAQSESVWYDKDGEKGRKSWHYMCAAPKKAEQKQAQATTTAASTEDGYTMKLIRFESMTECASVFTDCDEGGWELGDLKKAEALRRMKNGDLSQVEKAQKLIDSFQNALELERASWELGVAGAFPCVPEYLAGAPESMWHIEHEADDRTPLKMVVNTTMSGGIGHAQILARGVALLALAMRLAERRPVELFALVAGGSHSRAKDAAQGVLVRIGTAPLDLANACWLLTSTAYTRAFCYKAIRPLGFSGSWPWDMPPDSGNHQSKEAAAMRCALGLSERDLYIGGACLGNPDVDNPVEFVKAKLAQYEQTAAA